MCKAPLLTETQYLSAIEHEANRFADNVKERTSGWSMNWGRYIGRRAARANARYYASCIAAGK